MQIKKRYIILALLFIIYFTSRLYFSLQTPNFNDDKSYFALNEIEHISKTGKPITYNDSDNKINSIMPFYYYIFAPLMFFSNSIFLIKILNNLLASFLIVSIYLVTSYVIKSRRISLLCSILAASLPIYVNETINKINTNSLLLPLGFFMLYLFLKIEKLKSFELLLFVTILTILTSSSSFMFLLAIMIYLFLSFLENRKIPRIEIEYTSFVLLFFLWIILIVYKDVFQSLGFSIIWQNTPSLIMSNYFKNISLVTILGNIGFLPFIFGVYTVYSYLGKKKNKNTLLFVSLFLSTSILLLLKLVELKIGLVYFGISLVILFGQFLQDTMIFLTKSKVENRSELFFYSVVFLLVITQIIPSFFLMNQSVKQSLDTEYLNEFKYLKNTETNSHVLSIPEEGHLISFFGKRNEIINTNYFSFKDSDIIFNDVINFYKLIKNFKIDSIRILQKYDIEYFIVSDNLNNYNISSNISLNDNDCFNLTYSNKLKIYKFNKECGV
jgi:hypothetical protein